MVQGGLSTDNQTTVRIYFSILMLKMFQIDIDI